MDVTQPIRPSFADEHVIGIDPPMRPALPNVWRRRINAFAGRSLSDTAMSAEQALRSGMQRLYGLSLAPGTVDQLAVSAGVGAIGAAPADALIQVNPGLGIARSGEDVTFGRLVRIALGDVPVILRSDHAAAIAADKVIATDAPAGTAPAGATPGTMASRLRPELTRIVGDPLAGIAAHPLSADLPHVAILVAQPVCAEMLGQPLDPCPSAPADDAYIDLERIDGARLALYLWPSEMVAFDGGPDYSLPANDAGRRNRLAYSIFENERLLAEGEMHPWENWGLPLALVGFDPAWKLAFVDRYAVVRIGGAVKSRTPIVANSGDERLWQARLDQFAGQLSQMPSFDPATLKQAFVHLPPVGLLPPTLFDPLLRKQNFFPQSFQVTAIPVAQSNLNLVVDECAGLGPLDMKSSEQVELLVPVPDSLYDPGLLLIEQEDVRFGQAIRTIRDDRQNWLVRRQMARRRYDRLTETVSGVVTGWQGSDLPLEENSPAPHVQVPVEVTRTRRIAANTAKRSHVMAGANATLTVSSSDKIWFWVCIHDRSRLTGLSIRLASSVGANAGNFTKGVFWGVADAMPIAGDATGLDARRIDDPPPANIWVRLEVPASAIWDSSGGNLDSFAINGVEFTQRGGDVEWASFGKEDASGLVYTYIADDAPAGATLTADGDSGPGPWPWINVAGRETLTVPDFGTVVTADVRRAAALDQFRSNWTQDFLKDDLSSIDENGIDSFVSSVGARLKATNDALDLGFVRARTDIYRVRQIMLGADAASRLVTSPALADLALRNEGARATSDQISQFLAQAKAQTMPSATSSPPPPPTPPPAPPPPPATGGVQHVPARDQRFAGLERNSFQHDSMVLNVLAIPPQTQPVSRMFGAAAFPQGNATVSSDTLPVPAMAPPVAAAPIIGPAILRSTAAKPFVFQPSLSKAILSAGVSAITLDTGRFGSSDVQRQVPIAGLVERTVSVAERLTPSPAVQALDYALASKAAVVQTLSDLSTGNSGHPKGVALADIPMAGFHKSSDPNVVPTLSEWLADQALASSDQQFQDGDTLPASGGDKHESDYFTAAVQAIDNSIAIMRLVEGRVALFGNLASDLGNLRAQIESSAADAAVFLRSVDVEVAEARHDLATAEQLRGEEDARVAAVNARRAAILQNQVQAIAWRRSRSVDVRDELILVDVASGLAPNPVAICLGEHEDVPSEIQDYVDLLREVPVSWFPAVAAMIPRIQQLGSAQNAVTGMVERALTPRFLAAASQVTASNRFVKGVQNAMIATRLVVESRRISAASLDVSRIPILSLGEAQVQLGSMATIGDLISGAHRQPALSRAASDEIDSISSIAACLHERFGEVAPAVRLGWAETLSEFERPAPLANLIALPGWPEVPVDLRRILQGLVDWLFSQIDRSQGQAQDAVNELVRICILMAAHSPVDKIIPAQLVAPTPAKLGNKLFLTLDVTRVRSGMTALLRDEQDRIVSRARIEDIADGRAQARITHIERPVTTFTPALRVQLVSGMLR